MALANSRSNLVEFKPTNSSVPPHCIEAEIEILGGIMLDRSALARVPLSLRPEMFYLKAHETIYQTMLSLAQAGGPTDLIAVTTALEDSHQLEAVGGRLKLAQLVESTVSAVNIDALADLVRSKWVRRQTIQAGHQIVQLGYETATELDECLLEAERLVYALASDRHISDRGVRHCADGLVKVFQLLETGDSSRVLKTGLYDLDATISGLRQGDLIVVAGRTSMGKTQMSIYLAHQIAVVQKLPVIFFSAEMSEEKLLCRFLAHISGIDAAKLLVNQVADSEWTVLSQALGNLSDSPLYIDSHPNPSLSYMRTQIQRVVSERGAVGLVVLDYLQLLGGTSPLNRVEELDKITKGCRAIAKEFDVPFLALAQINRGVENRSNKRPMISDLRESGAIEQTADLILLLYRDEYYCPDTPDVGVIEVAVGKNRDGSTGVAKFLFDPKVSGFKNLAR